LILEDLGLQKENIETWLGQTAWESSPQVVTNTLVQLGLVTNDLKAKEYMAPFTEFV